MDPVTDVRHRPSMVSMIVWVLFCAVMWFWAIGDGRRLRRGCSSYNDFRTEVDD